MFCRLRRNTLKAVVRNVTHSYRGYGEETPGLVKVLETEAEIGPVETLLASICMCGHQTSHYVARYMYPPVEIDRIDFEIFAERDESATNALPIGHKSGDYPVPKISRIWGRAIVHTTANQTYIDFIEAESKRRCPIASTIAAGGTEVDIKYEKAIVDDDDYL
jgi:uncharacterized OsmC-like protein